MTMMEFLNTLFSGLTAVALIIGVIQLLFHSRQMHRDFEMLYVERYWTLMQQRSSSFVRTGIPSDEDLVVVQGYLQLCEDELDLRRIARVSDSTWGFWSGAIASQAQAPGYAEALAAMPEGAWPLLRAHLASGPKGDPLKKGRVWRLWHGL